MFSIFEYGIANESTCSSLTEATFKKSHLTAFGSIIHGHRELSMSTHNSKPTAVAKQTSPNKNSMPPLK